MQISSFKMPQTVCLLQCFKTRLLFIDIYFFNFINMLMYSYRQRVINGMQMRI